MKLRIIIFIIIIGIAAFLRFWHLGGVPVSPNWDEAALGYNAYSILKTGKDEYGVKYPWVLRSFGNYTPATYSYLAIPAIKVFGLRPFSVRLPSAVMGVITVIGAFFLSYELFSLQSKDRKRNLNVSLFVMLLMAISPWHIQFSRVAYEASAALPFVIWGFAFFLLGLKNYRWYFASAICYGMAINTYHSPRLFVPIFLLGLVILFCEKIWHQRKQLIFPILVGAIFVIPFFLYFSENQGQQITARFSATTIFTATKEKVSAIAKPTGVGIIPYYLFDSEMPTAIQEIWKGYLSHFSLKWLFITGDNSRHHAPSTGLLYLWELPFLLIGLYQILKSKGHFRSIMFLWILLVPIPASLTSEVPHAVRTLIFLPSFQIATALGIEKVFHYLKRYPLSYRLPILLSACLVIIFFVFQYFHLYFFQMNHEYSRFWQFGYESAVSYVLQNQEKYDKVIVSNKLEQPYVFFLFYLRYDPVKYLANGGTKDGEKQAFDKYEFRNVDYDGEVHDKKHLYLLSPIEARGNVIHTIRYFDGSEAVIIAE